MIEFCRLILRQRMVTVWCNIHHTIDLYLHLNYIFLSFFQKTSIFFKIRTGDFPHRLRGIWFVTVICTRAHQKSLIEFNIDLKMAVLIHVISWNMPRLATIPITNNVPLYIYLFFFMILLLFIGRSTAAIDNELLSITSFPIAYIYFSQS